MVVTQTDAANGSFRGAIDKPVVAPWLEQLFRALSASMGINRHSEFYTWLQTDIYDYLPHEVLLAAWGDFQKGEFEYDATSSIPEVTTQVLHSSPDLDALVSNLYNAVRNEQGGWCALHDFDDFAALCGIGTDPCLLSYPKAKMASVLVYTMRNERGTHDCLYLFYSREKRIEIDAPTLGFLMPHVDAALRRVKCLTRKAKPCKTPACSGIDKLSERELEVMAWVSEGKSNQEIGAILGISHNTVKNHLKRVFNKMNVTARSQAVRVYVQNQAI